MRTHGHKEGSTIHWGLLGGKGRASGRERMKRIAWGETSNVGEGEKCQMWVKGRKKAKHIAM